MLEPRIALVTILTKDVPAMRDFYRDVIGFPVESEAGNYVEFESSGVRFAVCHRQELANATQHSDYSATPVGQRFELAFPCQDPDEVDRAYQRLVAAGATPVKPPANMPWGQRTAFFSDPDGNIHELFANL